ncbi:hypothetical protein ACEWY4_024940 [Coilia grayii]|uniref:Ig-like domain-containing protein n=1 Tax=Coilia grayii TaxID=363190 RepID=A0ABD1IW47_9TELE
MVTMTCVIEVYSNWTYKWYKDNNNNVVFEGNIFKITEASESDEGLYWCQGKRTQKPRSSQLSDPVHVGLKERSSPIQLVVGIALGAGLCFVVMVVLYRCTQSKGIS